MSVVRVPLERSKSLPAAVLDGSTGSGEPLRDETERNATRKRPRLARLQRAWQVARTRVLWGARLYSLGARSVLGRSLLVTNPRVVSIGSYVTLCSDFVLADLAIGISGTPKIIIGDWTTILFRFQCNAAESVVIGNNVLFASNVLVTDSDHVVEPGGVPVTRNNKFVTRPVRIEDNCWIGQNAVILKGVTVGHDSIIGANSVVTRSVPPRSVVAGNPARIIRTLEPCR